MRFPISVYVGGPDFDLFKSVINQGIDSRLEGFTDSNFYRDGNRYNFDFADSELQVLIRRLIELENEEADQWIDDIVSLRYGTDDY